MKINAENGKFLIDIIAPSGLKPIFHIPDYQRSYSWGVDHCEQLFEDINENEKGYFLGSLVLVDKDRSKAGDTTKRYDIIDGQQRLTTLSLLYAALYECLEYKTNFSNTSLAFQLKSVLIIEETNSLHINLSEKYRRDFEYLIHKILKSNKEKTIKEPSGYKNRRIYKNFNYFRKKLENYNEQQAKELFSKINTTMLVQIITYDIFDAFTIFQSINDRGLDLSLVDIIKIEFIKDNNTQEEWENLLEKLSDGSNDDNLELQSRFFRHFYNAFFSKYKLQGYNKATKSNITRIFTELCKKHDSSKLLMELIEAAEIYGFLNYPLKENNNFNFCKQELLDLKHVQAKPAYLFLLYLFSSFSTDKDLLKQCVNLLVKYFIRRNFTNTPATNSLDKIFMDLIVKCEEIKKLNGKITLEDITNYLLKQEHSSLETFANSLRGDVYIDYPEATRFALCAIEQAHFTEETKIDLWERKNNKYTFTIEHVLPEAKNMLPEWIDMIAKGNKNEALVIQDRCLHKIGNLTLSIYNANLGKLPLDKKQSKKDENGNPIGYNNGKYLNKILKDIPQWNEENINERTERLIREIVQLFAFPGEKPLPKM